MALSSAVMKAKVDKLSTNMTRLDGIVNGDSSTEVITDNGLVPSVAKFFQGLSDSNILSGVIVYTSFVAMDADKTVLTEARKALLFDGSQSGLYLLNPTTDTWTLVDNIIDDKAPLESPTFTGTPTAPTPLVSDDSTTLATTEHVKDVVNAAISALDYASSIHTHVIDDVTGLQTALDDKAPIESPMFTGVPEAPTALNASNSYQLATTEFVQNIVAEIVGNIAGTLNLGTFTGSIVPDGSSVKEAVQALETSVEGISVGSFDSTALERKLKYFTRWIAG